MAGGVPVPLPTRAEDSLLTADSLRAAIMPRTVAHPAVPEQPDRRDHDAR
ncbi:MAG: hypothetical protein ACLVFA_07650 [Butyricicoccus sp.]